MATQSQSLPFNFGGLEAEASDFAAAKALIWPVPVESTVSYGGGTKDGPNAIIEASRNMELYDEELQTDTSSIGIHTLPAFPAGSHIDEIVAGIYAQAKVHLDPGKFLCSLGGEHSITGPLVHAFSERFSNLSVLQIDAHADLREQYDGTPNSHASAMRRAVEYCPLVQVGIRSMSAEEAAAVPNLNTRIFYAKDIHADLDWIPRAVDQLSENVYLTIDVDGLDPSIIPTTGTPEPGGLSWYTTLALLRHLAAHRRIVGMDVVELSPMKGLSAPDFAVAKLIYKTLGYVFRGDLQLLAADMD